MPIKWMALECIHYRKFTHQSDVWSYGEFRYRLTYKNQFGYHDGSRCPEERPGSRILEVAASGSGPSFTLSLGDSTEDQKCNGSLKKQSSAVSVEDASGQRYSADPTVLLAEKTQRDDTDEDGYMTPMKDKINTNHLNPVEENPFVTRRKNKDFHAIDNPGYHSTPNGKPKCEDEYMNDPLYLNTFNNTIDTSQEMFKRNGVCLPPQVTTAGHTSPMGKPYHLSHGPHVHFAIPPVQPAHPGSTSQNDHHIHSGPVQSAPIAQAPPICLISHQIQSGNPNRSPQQFHFPKSSVVGKIPGHPVQPCIQVGMPLVENMYKNSFDNPEYWHHNFPPSLTPQNSQDYNKFPSKQNGHTQPPTAENLPGLKLGSVVPPPPYRQRNTVV
ncbi:hypothetical protein DNTS_030578 [Danionella cerebrum]|uniref:Serine-threonine/tyrosine-protein kinase catalytic domain-containing protein n=1 Tax=Danionella cerebrum TaxID=2873325 RepID=A0A553PY17_9TELE|nr:hypothetical protein DNTS_030578 [Danionella translucida]